MALDQYYLLGTSGLRVSRLALGTMNFGTGGYHAAYGKTLDESRPIFRRYLDDGGNFVDTADFYTAGESETIVGRLVAEAKARDRVVLTTKFTNSVAPGDPNAGGNGRKHMIRALEDSLHRLGTDYVDLFLLHTWDRLTPVDEVLRTFDDLVRAGKVRYAGLSDVPSWYAAQAQTLARTQSLTPMINLQLPYSLVERQLEVEHLPMAQTLGYGITAWSPLGGGFLSGKYRHDAARGGLAGDGRLSTPRRSGLPPDGTGLASARAAGVGRQSTGRDDGAGGRQLGGHSAGISSAIVGGEQRGPARVHDGGPGLRAARRAAEDPGRGQRRAPESVYRMFTPPGYQSQLVNAGGSRSATSPTATEPSSEIGCRRTHDESPRGPGGTAGGLCDVRGIS